MHGAVTGDGEMLFVGALGRRFRRRDLADAATGKRIATVFNFRDAGGLVSYGPNAGAMCRQSARLIKKVLDGERAGEIPMEQPTRFELVVNLKTARAIASCGHRISRSSICVLQPIGRHQRL